MRVASRSYKDLVVWRLSMELVSEVYACTKKFPRDEAFGLSAQMRRAAVSLPSNMAEGSKRGSDKDFRHFLINARGSGAELETQVEIARGQKFISEDEYVVLTRKIDRILGMLHGLIARLTEN